MKYKNIFEYLYSYYIFFIKKSQIFVLIFQYFFIKKKYIKINSDYFNFNIFKNALNLYKK